MESYWRFCCLIPCTAITSWSGDFQWIFETGSSDPDYKKTEDFLIVIIGSPQTECGIMIYTIGFPTGRVSAILQPVRFFIPSSIRFLNFRNEPYQGSGYGCSIFFSPV